MAKKPFLTGDRPTGELHLGHWVGSLKERVRLQNTGDYELFILVADLQARGTHADKPELLKWAVKQVVRDYIAVGLDPTLKHVHFVLQSAVLERAAIEVLFAEQFTLAQIEGNPTLRAEIEQYGRENVSMAMFRMVESQTADIHMINPLNPRESIAVPVGADQLPLIRAASSAARKFNNVYGARLATCHAVTSDLDRLIGTDGKAKMSKSRKNAINLGDDEATIRKMVRGMFTDPNRTRADIPGKVEGNPLFIYLDAFHPDTAGVEEYKQRYRAGAVGDVEIKDFLADALVEMLAPMRERRAGPSDREITRWLKDGSEVARLQAAKVLKHMQQKTNTGLF